ncbi:MAG: hypothetical protein AB8G77_25225 [Rhodothermales bacterium]
MGKGALIAAIAAVFTTVLMLFSSQEQSNQTDNKENERRSLEIARELAMVGRKLVLTDWIDKDGSDTAIQPFLDTLSRDGGQIWIEGYTPGGGRLDFRVYGAYDSTVHEIRSLYAWKGFNANTVQLKVGALQPSFSNLAELDFNGIAIDDQSLQDLEEVIVDDLGLVADLSTYGLGLFETKTALETELSAHPASIAITEVDQAQRDAYDGQDGLFYPDQINEAVEVYALANPSEHQIESDASLIGATFGKGDGKSLLTFEGDMTLANDLTGQGILVVEGDFIVPPGVTFSWDGVILVKPPQTSLNPVIDLGGNVDINGAIVALHEGMPDTGHMDVSVYRDMTGAWSSAFGLATLGAPFYDTEILKHTHDFTTLKGNRVVFHSDNGLEPNHQSQTYFNETLGEITGDIFFEIVNSDEHGRGVIMLDKTTGSPVLQTAGAGFDGSIAAPGNTYRTDPLPISELEHFDISITRLPSLKKMWDTGSNYDPCYHPSNQTSGPECVWADYDRYGALALRMYEQNLGVDKLVYEASLYWHRRTDEEDEFEDEMTDLATDLQSDDYGLDFIIGDDAAIHGDKNALLGLGAFSGFAAGFGVTNLGTWHKQWEPGDIGHPLDQVILTE